MINAVPNELQTPRNEQVLAYLTGRSAHDDVAEALASATSRLGDIGKFCPDSASYLYVLVHTANTVFGFATGMSTVAFRLNEEFRSRALATGAHELNGLDGWAAFELFRADWPTVDVRFWATQAYVQAREQGDDYSPS